MTSVVLATEDALSEAIGLRLLAEPTCSLHCDSRLRRNGAGYLRSRVQSWCEMARRVPVLVITDLDMKSCPASFVAQWLGARKQPENLLIRVAVREAESWLLADHDGMQRLLGSTVRLPARPDALADPKQRLLQLARSAKREIREDLLASRGAVAAQGLAYNARLSAFVSQDWCPERASTRSDSLHRTRKRLAELARRVR